MEVPGGLGIYRFGAAGRIAGLLIGVRGQANVIGICRRGIFYRFGAAIYSPDAGRFDSVFVLKTRIGAIDLLFDKWLKDEIVPVLFKCRWIRGNITIRRSGLYSFQLFATDPDLVIEADRKSYETFSDTEAEDSSYFQSNYKERY